MSSVRRDTRDRGLPGWTFVAVDDGHIRADCAMAPCRSGQVAGPAAWAGRSGCREQVYASRARRSNGSDCGSGQSKRVPIVWILKVAESLHPVA